MNHKEKQTRKDIETHLKYEEMKLKKEAAKLRRREEKSSGLPRVSEENWEEILDASRVKQPGRESLVIGVERLRSAKEDAQSKTVPAGGSEGRVLSVSGAACRVFIPESPEGDSTVPAGDLDCRLGEALRGQPRLVVGDRVAVILREATAEIVACLPRRTTLSRIDPSNRHAARVIVANVDLVGHVIAADSLPEKAGLVDRVLIATQLGGAVPLLCINKIDAVTARSRAAIEETVARYRPLGLEVFYHSAATGDGIDPLFDRLRGQTSALVGHSGVGKSSLLNALDHRLALRTTEVRKRGTGRHTTTASTLYDLGDSTYVIDTPGVREFGLWSFDRERLRLFFPELEDVVCKFRDCSHTHEPGCGVSDELGDSKILPERYEMYKRLFEGIGKEEGR